MKNQTINLALIFIVLYFGLGAFFPFNSIYLQDTLHYTGQQIGLFYSLAALIVVISVPIFGVLADRLRSPKVIYIICASFAIVFLIPYSLVKPFYIITTLYILINGIRSALVPLLDTIALDYCAQTKVNFGILRSLGSFSFICASLITGFLLEKFSDFTSLFLYIHMISLSLSIYFSFFQKNTYMNSEVSNNFKEDFMQLLKNRQFLLAITIMGLSYGIIQVSQAYLSLSITDLGGGADIIGISFFFLVIPEVIFFSLVIKLSKKINHIYLMLVGTMYLLLRWIVLIFTNSIPILLVASTAHGIVMAFTIIVGFDLIKKIVKPHLISSAMSLYTALANVFFAIISYSAGLLMDAGSIKNTYFLYSFTTILIIVGIITYVISYSRRNE